MEKLSVAPNGLKPTLVMIVVQMSFSAMNIFYKLAAMDGMNLNILVAYRFLFAAAFMLPLALLVEGNKLMKLTWTILSQTFVSGLVGASLAQTFYLRGLAMSSATFAMATTNLVPVMTFILAVSLRSEKLGWDRVAGKVKVLGTIVGVTGAMILTFYKGPCIDIWNTHIDLLRNGIGHEEHPRLIQLLGIFLCFCGSFCYALWLTVQAKITKRYPFPYTSIALMNVVASVQCTIFTLCLERDWSRWKLGFNIRLFTAAYSGIGASGVAFTMAAWCVQMRGPIFVSAFNPLTVVVGVFAASLLLDEKLHLGSVLGGVIIICGLYAVLWGKSNETKKVDQMHALPVKSCNNQNQTC
ncbi:hypothetical protein ACET3Z_024541 [Daucus carota]